VVLCVFVVDHEDEMAKKTTSHAYAQALLELATEPWMKGLHLANRRLHEQHAVARLEDPAIPADVKTRLLASVLADVSPQVMAFVRALSADGDLNKLDTICEEFESLVVRRSKYVLAHVRSAVPLTDDERTALEQTLAQRFGGSLETEYEVDPALIGGVVVRVGDEVIDGSLAGKLSALRERLAS
jgi:F-type H+-transporting ATPase subunit delta